MLLLALLTAACAGTPHPDAAPRTADSGRLDGDRQELARGHFDSDLRVTTADGRGDPIHGMHEGPAGTSRDGGAPLRCTHQWLRDAGLNGGGALRVTRHGVGLWPLPTFDPGAGQIELWVAPGPDTRSRQVLFNLRGARSLDGDAFTDLVVGQPASGAAPAFTRVYFGTPTGLDVEHPALLATRAPRGLGAGDLDRDGDLELVIADNQAETGKDHPGAVLIFDGPWRAGARRPVPDRQFPLALPQGLVLADFDGRDGVDLAVASFLGGSSAVGGWLNDGSGVLQPRFAALGIQCLTAAEGLAAGDANRDGVLDLLYGAFDDDPCQLLIGELAGGNFRIGRQLAVSAPAGLRTLGVSLGDVNGDGWPDAVLAHPLFDNGPGRARGRVAVHLNDGQGGFSVEPDWTLATPRPFTLDATHDLNHDGFLDLVLANWRDGAHATHASRVIPGPLPPARGSAAPPTLFAVDDAVSLAVGDFDADGIDDLFFRSASGHASPVFLLDMDGRSKAGAFADGRQRPTMLLPTEPCPPLPAGEGAGVMAVQVGGSTAYGSHLDRAGSLQLSVEHDALHFVIHDGHGVAHEVWAPWPARGPGPTAEGGFLRVRAGWSAREGTLGLRVGPDTSVTRDDPAWQPGATAPVFQLGTDPENQFPATGWLLDELRLETGPGACLDSASEASRRRAR